MRRVAKFLVIHGPNLDLLGLRQPAIYGRTTLAQVDARLRRQAASRGVAVEAFQSNYETEIVSRIATARRGGFRGIVINPAAYTHTSEAIPQALRACGLPVAEVHLSNVHAREPFRRLSLVAPVAVGGVFGFGIDSYSLALEALVRHVGGDARSARFARRAGRLTRSGGSRRMGRTHD